ncbi:MAG: tetratricopeptide repeat protein [Sphingomonadales bacterium]|nr:tetratricopeptide repeat protein [Sphingomonadales bacterium]
MALRPNRPQSRSDQLAERDAAQQDGFLREVDDALRQDEMLGAMQRYGKPLAAAVLAGLAALAGYLWWADHSKQQTARRGEDMTLALDQVEAGRLDAGMRALEPLTKDGGDGSQAAARMMQGGILLEQGHKDQAARMFAAVSADSNAPQPYRDLASVREVTANFDTMKPEDVIARLKPLAVPGNPWFGSAGELVGMAYVKQGRNDLAGPLFAAVAKEKEAPESVRSRARQMAGLLGVDAIDDVAKAAGLGDAGQAGPAAAPAKP